MSEDDSGDNALEADVKLRYGRALCVNAHHLVMEKQSVNQSRLDDCHSKMKVSKSKVHK